MRAEYGQVSNATDDRVLHVFRYSWITGAIIISLTASVLYFDPFFHNALSYCLFALALMRMLLEMRRRLTITEHSIEYRPWLGRDMDITVLFNEIKEIHLGESTTTYLGINPSPKEAIAIKTSDRNLITMPINFGRTDMPDSLIFDWIMKTEVKLTRTGPTSISKLDAPS